jgi:2,5-diamino-6-(ribosylamino)-4(3H)-pyrimidinone 5'-phosphate reductase
MDVLVNAAISADGKLSTRRREQVRISGDDDFARVDRLRAGADAVLVGVGTVLADDPSLVSHDRGHREQLGKSGAPARVVADSRARTPPDAAVLGGEPETYGLVSAAAPDARRTRLREAGARLIEAGGERVDLAAALDALEAKGVADLLVEGGGEVVFSLFEAGLVDRLSTFVGALVLGGRAAPTLADGEGFVETAPALELEGVERVDDGAVLEWTLDGARDLIEGGRSPQGE